MTNQKTTFLKAFKAWVPFALIILIFSGLIYVAVQQNYRLSANDPQIQIAQDVSNAISAGTAAPDSIVPPNPTQDIAQSLSPFVIIYNATTTPLGSSVALNGKIPTLPSGVFDNAKKNGEDRFTWEPTKGVRVAAVLRYFSGSVSGYVLAGRLLTEVEKREGQLTSMTVAACILALVLTYLVLVLMKMMINKQDTIVIHEEKTMEIDMPAPENKE